MSSSATYPDMQQSPTAFKSTGPPGNTGTMNHTAKGLVATTISIVWTIIIIREIVLFRMHTPRTFWTRISMFVLLMIGQIVIVATL